jgi:hypothetical protein
MENPVQLTPRFTEAVDYARFTSAFAKGHRCRIKFDMRCVDGRKEVKTEDEERATCNVILSASI